MKITAKTARLWERSLRAHNVYKPYVGADNGTIYIESYPLTAIIKDAPVDPELGPCYAYKITDASLSRIGQDPVLHTGRIFFGQDSVAIVGNYLVGFHEKAYARAKEQDTVALNR